MLGGAGVAPAVLLLPMLEDDDLLDGVPDDAPAVTDADLLDDDEEEVDEDAGGKRGRQTADADDAMEPAGLSRALEDDPPERAAAARKSGKRRIIQHVAKEDGGGRIDPRLRGGMRAPPSLGPRRLRRRRRPRRSSVARRCSRARSAPRSLASKRRQTRWTP